MIRFIHLLSGEQPKQDIIIIDDYKCDPGFYRYQGRIISELEKDELSKQCNKLVIMRKYKKE